MKPNGSQRLFKTSFYDPGTLQRAKPKTGPGHPTCFNAWQGQSSLRTCHTALLGNPKFCSGPGSAKRACKTLRMGGRSGPTASHQPLELEIWASQSASVGAMLTEGDKLAGPSGYFLRQGTWDQVPTCPEPPQVQRDRLYFSVRTPVITLSPTCGPPTAVHAFGSFKFCTKNLDPELLALTWLENNHAP